MSAFTYIFLPRKISDVPYEPNDETGYMAYNYPNSNKLIPWFLKSASFSKEDLSSIMLAEETVMRPFIPTEYQCYELLGNFEESIDERIYEHMIKLLGLEKTIGIIAKNILADNISRHQLYHLIDKKH